MPNVTLKQLRAFTTIARERSFTRAAVLLGVSQSALTIAVRELETELGLRLLDRSTRSVELTQQAVEFLPAVERVLGELNHSLEDMRTLAERRKGSVVIAAAASFITYVLAPAVAKLARTYPGIAVRLNEETTETVARRVQDGEADFGITTLWRPLDGLDGELLLKDRLGVVSPRGHPLAVHTGNLRWRHLSPYPVVSLSRGAGVRELIDHTKAVAAVLRPPTYEVSSIFVLKALIERSVGIAVLPAFAARAVMTDALVFRPVYQPSVERELFVIRRKARSLTPASLQVARLMMEELELVTADQHIQISAPTTSLRFFVD
jgi:DNA-binding transcriptional LysR family regulator